MCLCLRHPNHCAFRQLGCTSESSQPSSASPGHSARVHRAREDRLDLVHPDIGKEESRDRPHGTVLGLGQKIRSRSRK